VSGIRTVVILQKTRVFRGDWLNVTNQPGMRTLLIQTPAAAAQSLTYWRHFDETGVVSQFDADGLERHLRSTNIDLGNAVIISNDEYCLPICAELRGRLGVPGPSPERIAPFTDKLVMKRMAQAGGVAVPRFLEFEPDAYAVAPDGYMDKIVETLGLPLIAKPVAESNSKNVFKLESRATLRQWCAGNAVARGLELEEFIDGTVFCCNTVIRAGRRRNVMVSEWINHPLDFDLGVPGGSISLPDDSDAYVAVDLFNTRLLDALSPPDDCVTHLECFRRPSGEVVLLEIAARPPGANVTSAGEIRTGWNFEELSLLLQMGAPVDIPETPGPYAAWTLFPKRDGVVEALARPDIQSKYRLHWNVGLGEKLGDISRGTAHNAKQSTAMLVFWNHDYPTLRTDFEHMRSFMPVTLAPLAAAAERKMTERKIAE
jgi:hypothetical protein